MHLYARSRSLTKAAVAALVTSLALATIRVATVHVPFAPETTVVDMVLMSPLVPALLFVGTFALPLASLEEIAVTRMRVLRALHAGVVSGTTAVTALAGFGRPVAEREALLVNSMLLVGLVLFCSVISDGALPWLVPVMVCVACFFYGKSPSDGSIRNWAVLLLDPSPTTVGTGALFFVIGCCGFVARGPRGSSMTKATRPEFPEQRG